MKNPWRRLGSKEVYKNSWITVREDQVVRPDGKEGIYGVVEMAHKSVAVLAVKERMIYLIKQWWYPIEEARATIITGGVNSGEDLEKAALRELKEETGLVAGNLEKIGFLHISCGLTNEAAHIYLARDLQQLGAEPEDTEQIELIETNIDEAMAMIEREEITDAPSVVALQRYYLGLIQGKY